MAECVQASWGTDRALDVALRRWWLTRDRQGRPMYWLSQDMGRAGSVPLVHREFFRRISASSDLRDQLQETLSRKQSPNKLNSTLRFLAVSHDLMHDPRLRGTGVLWGIYSTARVELARRLRLMMPRFGRPTEAPMPAAPRPGPSPAGARSGAGIPGPPAGDRPGRRATGAIRTGRRVTMATAEAVEFIECPVTEAFALLSQPDKHPLWQTDLETDGISRR